MSRKGEDNMAPETDLAPTSFLSSPSHSASFKLDMQLRV